MQDLLLTSLLLLLDVVLYVYHVVQNNMMLRGAVFVYGHTIGTMAGVARTYLVPRQARAMGCGASATRHPMAIRMLYLQAGSSFSSLSS